MTKTHVHKTLAGTITATPKSLEDIGFTADEVAGMVGLEITCGDAGDIRLTTDGTTPTATLGRVVNTDETVYANDVGGYEAWRFVRESADVACTFTIDTLKDV